MTPSQRTQQYLKTLAERLSGRPDCKYVQFKVGIGHAVVPGQPGDELIPEQDYSKYVFFSPNLTAYRDMHHRSDTDVFRIQELVIRKYFPELILGEDQYGRFQVDTSKLVLGVYEYQMATGGTSKRRRWVRIA